MKYGQKIQCHVAAAGRAGSSASFFVTPPPPPARAAERRSSGAGTIPQHSPRSSLPRRAERADDVTTAAEKFVIFKSEPRQVHRVNSPLLGWKTGTDIIGPLWFDGLRGRMTDARQDCRWILS